MTSRSSCAMVVSTSPNVWVQRRMIMLRFFRGLSGLCAAFLCFGAALAQPISLIPQGWVEEPVPLGIAMYNVFMRVVSRDVEEPGSGAAYLMNGVGINDAARAEAVFEYIRPAFYAGRYSSEARPREF